MKTLLNILFCLLLTNSLFGTAQAPDKLIYKGDTLNMFSNPLESYFDDKPRPDSLFSYESTACWRGYIAYWEIKNDSLFLNSIVANNTIDLSLIFKTRNTDSPIFADWVTSNLLVVSGRCIHYEHFGYSSIYEYENILFINKGLLKKEEKFDNSMSKKSIYTQDKKLLINYIQNNINYEIIPDSIKNEKVVIKIVSVTEDGIIDEIEVVKSNNPICEKEAIRVVKSIPEWDVLYQKGELKSIPWLIPIIFKQE